jgi:hypothetical protein
VLIPKKGHAPNLRLCTKLDRKPEVVAAVTDSRGKLINPDCGPLRCNLQPKPVADLDGCEGAQRPESTLRDQIARQLKCHRVKVCIDFWLFGACFVTTESPHFEVN